VLLGSAAWGFGATIPNGAPIEQPSRYQPCPARPLSCADESVPLGDTRLCSGFVVADPAITGFDRWDA
jgi:hypothetical protein